MGLLVRSPQQAQRSTHHRAINPRVTAAPAFLAPTTLETALRTRGHGMSGTAPWQQAAGVYAHNACKRRHNCTRTALRPLKLPANVLLRGLAAVTLGSAHVSRGSRSLSAASALTTTVLCCRSSCCSSLWIVLRCCTRPGSSCTRGSSWNKKSQIATRKGGAVRRLKTQRPRYHYVLQPF